MLVGNTTNEFIASTEDGKPVHVGQLGNLTLIRKWTASGGTAPYYYHFDVAMPGDDAGAFHSSDLWFSFGSLAKCWRPFVGWHYDLARRMGLYWTNLPPMAIPTGTDRDGTPLPVWILASVRMPRHAFVPRTGHADSWLTETDRKAFGMRGAAGCFILICKQGRSLRIVPAARNDLRCACRRISRLIIRLFTVFCRLVRRWRLAERLGPLKTLFGVVQARSCLKCSRPDVSPYKGVSAWIPSDVASQLLDVAVSVNRGDYEKTEPPLMTIADTMAYLQCSRRLSCSGYPTPGTLLGTGNVGIGVHLAIPYVLFAAVLACSDFSENQGLPDFLRKPSRRSFEPSSR